MNRQRMNINVGLTLLAATALAAAAPQSPRAIFKESTDLPDRLSLDKRSPYYHRAAINRGVGVRFKGVEKTNVYEYCVSEGWVRLIVGRTLKADGTPMTTKLQGVVEPYWR